MTVLAPGPGVTPAPDWVAAGTPEPLRSRLISALGRDAVLDRATDLIRFASDASPYRQIPRAVVEPRDAAGVAAVMALAREEELPVAFRAAGTSLMGQSQTDGVLVRLGPAWRGIEVLDDGARIRSGPGAILGHLNRVLEPHGRKVGPDPASTDFAMVGGIVANNSGGMRCGTERDPYSTVSSLTFTLPSGTTIDTAAPGAAERFAAAEPRLCAGLAEIRHRIRADEDLSARIRHKFEIKNTVGYRLCAFLDADEPLEILRRLLVGSEGTLAFLSEVIFETVPRPELSTVIWAHFPSTDAAVAAVGELVDAGATAVELMTGSTLEVAASSIPGAPPEWTDLPDGSAALLIELSGSEPDDLAQGEFAADAVLEGCELLWPVEWARDPERIALNWHVRHSLHALAGDLHPPGTALIVEDVCVRPERMAECAGALQELLAHHGFRRGRAADRRRRHLLHPGSERRGSGSLGRGREAPRRTRSPRLDRLGRAAPARPAGFAAARWHRSCPSDLLLPSPRPRLRARADCRSNRVGGHGPAIGELLRIRRRPRLPPPGADRRGTRRGAREVDRASGDLHLCANRTCEIGLTRETGERWESFVYALEQATRGR